jgi:hypothetical protein
MNLSPARIVLTRAGVFAALRQARRNNCVGLKF